MGQVIYPRWRPLLVPDKLYTHDGACPSSTCPNLFHKVGLQGRGLEGTWTWPDYLVNRDDQKNEGPFGEKNCTEIEK